MLATDNIIIGYNGIRWKLVEISATQFYEAMSDSSAMYNYRLDVAP